MSQNFVIQVAVAVIRNGDGDWLCCQRSDTDDHAGYWEFPGGKFESGENLLQALIRELKEELDLNLAGYKIEPYMSFQWQHPGKLVKLNVAIIELSKIRAEYIPLKPLVHQNVAWLPTDRLDSLDWLESNKVIVSQIKKDFR